MIKKIIIFLGVLIFLTTIYDAETIQSNISEGRYFCMVCKDTDEFPQGDVCMTCTEPDYNFTFNLNYTNTTGINIDEGLNKTKEVNKTKDIDSVLREIITENKIKNNINDDKNSKTVSDLSGLEYSCH